MAQSTIFPIFLRAEYRNDGQGFARFQSDAQRAANVAKAEFRSVGAVIDEALSRQRNDARALDLGIDELRQAAAAQRARAIAAREVAEATARLAPIQAKEGVSLRVSADATRRYANEQDRLATELEQQIRVQELVQQELNKTASATDLVASANRRGTTATQNVINSQRASRTAFIQLGQQMQDVAVQAQMGTNAFIIFGQQVPQAAFALSGLANSANRTQAIVGRVATFLSGPFGAAIFVAIAALGPLVQRLLDVGNASEDAARSVADLVNEKIKAAEEARNAAAAEEAYRLTVDGLTESIRNNREALQQLNEVKRTSAELSLENALKDFAAAQALQFNTQQTLLNAAAKLDAQKAALTDPTQDAVGNIFAIESEQSRIRELLGQSAEIAGQAAEARKAINEAQAAISVERGRAGSEGEINRRYDALIEKATQAAIASGDVREALVAEVAALEQKRKAELEANKESRGRRSSAGDDRRRARAAEQLATFGEQAAEQIQRINERFDEQTLLVDRAAQSTRQLDRIIAELAERKPANFQELIDQAEEAKRTIEDALVRPFQVLREESENRLAIEEALAQGRVDEAAALQEIFRIQQQIGPLTSEQRDDVRDIVGFEQQRIRYLRDQQALIEAQMDVVQTVRRDLTDILSGRSTDFFKNFRQAIRDLQGQRLFEKLFGPAFRAIEEELQKSTPQGKANAAFTAQVTKAAESTKAVGEAAITLAEEFDRAFGIVRAAATGAANDNSPGTVGSKIVVPGNREPKVEIIPRSTKEIADAIGKATVEGFLAPLKDILGEKFFNGMATVLGNVLSAYVRGGEAGAVFQGLSELTSGIEGAEGISAAFGKAAAGAEVGTQIAGISKALGLGGSTTGAQIGGALGSFAGPIGTVVGAIAGNIIGGLVKATKRGSATIGNLGGELAIVGTRGNSRSRIEQSTGLAGSALDSIQNIADQLGASVDASRGSVSIGVRKNNIRVDTSGQGKTKTSRGAIDFGDDAEGAVRAAVLDLIQDGVITGLRAAEQNLLRARNDIEAALRDVLTFRSVFDRLQEIRDPLGFAIEQLNREFSGLIDLFERAGASTEEFAELEELYNLERARAIEDATDRVVGSLRQLLNDLTIGDSGLSLRSRRANALGQFNDLAARVAAGDTSAFDDFADISQQLLDIERQLFGSTQSYFDRLAQITQLTEQAIADQTNVTSIGSGAPSPFEERAEINRSIDTMNADVTGWLRAINDNLIALNPTARTPVGVAGGGRATTPFPSLIQNF